MLMVVMSTYFGENQVLSLCMCVYKCIIVACELYHLCLYFQKISASLRFCCNTLHLVHLDIITSDTNWIIYKNLQVLIQELLMA